MDYSEVKNKMEETPVIIEYSLPGVRTYRLNTIPDERGFFSEALRRDWHDFIDDWIGQANISYGYPNVVRAWHRHVLGQVDYFLVLQGALKICVYDEKTAGLVEIISSRFNPILVRVPGHYYHGTKTISDIPSLAIYFTNKLYNYENPDEQRRPWNDPQIIPSEINGNKEDARVNKSWDWFYPPYK